MASFTEFRRRLWPYVAGRDARQPLWQAAPHPGLKAPTMKRRDFIAGLAGAAAWPIGAPGQQTAMPIIGFLSSLAPEGAVPLVAAFRGGLSASGYVEGKNVAIEYRWARGDYDRLPVLARELVAREQRFSQRLAVNLQQLLPGQQAPTCPSCLWLVAIPSSWA